ncbi:hypothetical protein FK515_30025, partial [Klebsiella pneumoniae]|nr:hypothetical protein [Klebsiella pneumoniae]
MIELLIGPHGEEIFIIFIFSISVVGAKGEPFKVPILKEVEVETEKKICRNDLLLLPKAEYNLLGRDLILE